SRGEETSEISLARPTRSRKRLTITLLECELCHQVVERRSGIKQHSVEWRRAIKRARSCAAQGCPPARARGKKTARFQAATPTTKIRRMATGHAVSQTHKPSVTGRKSTQTTPWTIRGNVRSQFHAASRLPWLQMSATANP